MGWSAAEVDRASPWQFRAAWAGWRKANTVKPSGPRPPTLAEHQAAMAFARTVH
jgi:hypothetical protein